MRRGLIFAGSRQQSTVCTSNRLYNGHIVRQKRGTEVWDNEWRTPLHHAAVCGNVEAVRLLLECGAACVPDKRGATALHYCAANGHAALAERLLRHFHFKVSQVLHHC